MDIGFLSLEEIDETEYGLQIPKPENVSEENTLKEKRKSKKRKLNECNDSSAIEAETQNEEELEDEEKGEGEELKQKKKKQKKKKRKKKKKGNLENETEENAEPAAGWFGLIFSLFLVVVIHIPFVLIVP